MLARLQFNWPSNTSPCIGIGILLLEKSLDYQLDR